MCVCVCVWEYIYETAAADQWQETALMGHDQLHAAHYTIEL